LTGLEKLRALDLRETRETDHGIESLKALRNLEYLELSGTEVTDHGVKELVSLEQLQWLNLEDTLVSDIAINELRVARPKLAVRAPRQYSIPRPWAGNHPHVSQSDLFDMIEPNWESSLVQRKGWRYDTTDR
jgi:hypothetical protein